MRLQGETRCWRLIVGALVLVSCSGGRAGAQSDPQSAFPQATPAGTRPADRPGKYQLGRLFLTPRFRLGPISYDSNVLYSATDAQSDVIVALGPALDLVLPVATAARFYANGAADYLYFVEDASQRRWTGYGAVGFSARGARTQGLVEEYYRETFGRPGYDVDERVEEVVEGTRASIRLGLVGRASLALDGLRERVETESGDEYLGTSFSDALDKSRQLLAAEPTFRLSVKTSLVFRAEYERQRFPSDPGRDANRLLFALGLRTDASALIAGRALAGRRQYESEPGNLRRNLTYVDLDARVGSSRTRLGVAFLRDFQDSFFLPADGVPVQTVESTTVSLERRLSARFDLRAFARETRYETSSPITIVPPEGPPETHLRNDRNRDAGVDLGYRFRPNFRVGIRASYRDRSSPFSTFNVEGLVVGFNAELNPDLPWID